MTRSTPIATAEPRPVTAWIAMLAVVAAFGYVAWDGALWDARFGLVLHLLGAGAILGGGVLAIRTGRVPRTPLDAAVLGLVAAFALATVSAMNLGMSLRAMAVIVAYAAMLPVALVALRHRPSWLALAMAGPVLLLAVPTLVVLVARRIEWVVVGAPGLPPIRLPGEGTPFGSVAVPPFIIWPAWALAGLIESERWRRLVQGGLVAVGVPLTVLSGSRSAWLAIAVTGAVVVVPWAWARRGRILHRPDRRTLALGLGIAAVAVAGAVLVAPRVTAITSLVYRASLWRDTLRAWATDPLLGIGPGFMPYARQAAAPDFSFPVRQPHSHNLPLGVLGDAGLLGLLAAAILVGLVAWHAGPWRARTRMGRRAGYVLLGLGVGGLFEDISFLPGFNLLAIALVAVCLADAGVVRWVAPPRGRTVTAAALAGGGATAVLVGAMVVADAGGIAYRSGVDAAAEGRWDVATAAFERSVAIDPWHPAGPKALAVAADRAGDPTLARRAAEEAVARNPGDAPSWINLAWLCSDQGDSACQLRATERGAATAEFAGADLLNAALSYDAMGRAADADGAFRRSLLVQPVTAFVLDWPRPIRLGDPVLDDGGRPAELNALIGAWATGAPIDPTAISDPAARALAHAIRGERSEAETWLERAIAASPESAITWDVVVALRDRWGTLTAEDLAVAGAVRGRALPDPNSELGEPGLRYDIASFRAYPANGYVRAARRLETMPRYPWVLERTLP